MTDEPPPWQGPGTPDAFPVRFDLRNNPFAILGATPRTPIQELQALAARAATPEAAAAARTLAVPRSRLGAEISFLPGAADAAPAIMSALAKGERPAMPWLPPAAQANIAAHLCAAGQAEASDRAAVLAFQPGPGDPALADAINADRCVAGMPPVQPTALRSEQDRLAGQHAAALVAAMPAGPGGAAMLASLVRTAPSGPSTTIARRAAAAWARATGAELAALEESAAKLVNRLRGEPDAAALAALCAAIRDWAALGAPQRAADARAGLDHEAALTAMRPWCALAASLARDGSPELAHTLACTLADTFGDLPGEAAALRQSAQDIAGQLDDLALEQHLAPLRDLVQRLGAAPAPLQAELRRRPFGPTSRGAAGDLWRLFDAACQASAASDAPWIILRALVHQLGGPWRREGAASAVQLQRGLIERAGAAGRTILMERLAAEQRGLVEASLTHDYEVLLRKASGFWTGGIIQRRGALKALRRLLPHVSDPTRRAALSAQERALAGTSKRGWIVTAIFAVALFGVVQGAIQDRDYARNAPYRQPASRNAPSPPSPDPALLSPDDGPGDHFFPEPKLPVPLPPSSKFPDDPGAPAGAPAAVQQLSFPSRSPREVQPSFTGGPLTASEAAWCVFNGARLDAAEAAAGPSQRPAVQVTRLAWTRLCRGTRSMPRQLGATLQRAAGADGRLATEGRAMLQSTP